jgi:hypothetical protein
MMRKILITICILSLLCPVAVYAWHITGANLPAGVLKFVTR